MHFVFQGQEDIKVDKETWVREFVLEGIIDYGQGNSSNYCLNDSV